MPTPQWIKKLTGESGVHYVMAELLKRGILASMTPARFPEEDVYMVKKGSNKSAFIQVKSPHPLRSRHL